jgi:hypothetical protein
LTSIATAFWAAALCKVRIMAEKPNNNLKKRKQLVVFPIVKASE